MLAAKNSDINAILAFSPGEYFQFEDKTISEWASESECPVFITSSKKEYEDCKLIFDKIKNKESVQFKPEQSGFHGSKALWKSKKGNDEYWKEVIDFLKKL